MFEVRKLQLDDLTTMASEPSNQYVQSWLKTGMAQDWADSKETFSGFIKNELMICVGLTPYWEGRAHIWAIFSCNAKKNFTTVFRGMKRFMRETPYRRVEMDIPLGAKFTPLAHRRALLLGFKLECPFARAYRPNGDDSALYSWTRG